MGFTVFHGATGSPVLRWLAELHRWPSDFPVPFLHGGPALFFFYGLQWRFRSHWMGVAATSVAGAVRPMHQRLPQLTAHTARTDLWSQAVSGQCGKQDEVEPKQRMSSAVVSMGGGPSGPCYPCAFAVEARAGTSRRLRVATVGTAGGSYGGPAQGHCQDRAGRCVRAHGRGQPPRGAMSGEGGGTATLMCRGRGRPLSGPSRASATPRVPWARGRGSRRRCQYWPRGGYDLRVPVSPA